MVIISLFLKNVFASVDIIYNKQHVFFCNCTKVLLNALKVCYCETIFINISTTYGSRDIKKLGEMSIVDETFGCFLSELHGK